MDQTAVWIMHAEYLYHSISVTFMWPLKQRGRPSDFRQRVSGACSGGKHFGRNVNFNLAVQTA